MVKRSLYLYSTTNFPPYSMWGVTWVVHCHHSGTIHYVIASSCSLFLDIFEWFNLDFVYITLLFYQILGVQSSHLFITSQPWDVMQQPSIVHALSSSSRFFPPQYVTLTLELIVPCARIKFQVVLFLDVVHFIPFITHVSLFLFITLVIYIKEGNICRPCIFCFKGISGRERRSY